MDLSDCFTSTFTNSHTHNWILNIHISNNVTIDTLAQVLANEIVKFRCRRCLQHYKSWKNKVENNKNHNDASKLALRAFLSPTFGDPDEKTKTPNIDHLEGFIGEWLWYFLSIENPIDPIIHQIPPSFKSTDPGGDAFFVHRLKNKEILFRLWEMKKFSPRKDDSTQQLNTTLAKAYSQINLKALEYLARITATEQELNDPELEEFIGKLGDLWIEGSPQAAAGVSIATSLKHVSKQCFDDFGNQFPKFTKPIRLLGVLTGIEDYSQFALKVKDFVWKGL